MRRRAFLRNLAFGGLGVSLTVFAQQPPRLPRVSVLSAFPQSDVATST